MARDYGIFRGIEIVASIILGTKILLNAVIVYKNSSSDWI